MAFIDDSKEVRGIIMKHCSADRLVTDVLDLSKTTALVRDLLGKSPD